MAPDQRLKETQRQLFGEGWRDSWRNYSMKTAGTRLIGEMGQIYCDVVLKLLPDLDSDGVDYWDAVIFISDAI